MKTLKFFSIALALCLSFMFIFPKNPVSALPFKIFEQACQNAEGSVTCNQADQQNANNTNPVSGPQGALQTGANIFALVASIAAVIYIVYSGIVFATAGGVRSGDNSTRIRQARSHIISSLIGLVIIALAWTLVSFVNYKILRG